MRLLQKNIIKNNHVYIYIYICILYTHTHTQSNIYIYICILYTHTHTHTHTHKVLVYNNSSGCYSLCLASNYKQGVTRHICSSLFPLEGANASGLRFSADAQRLSCTSSNALTLKDIYESECWTGMHVNTMVHTCGGPSETSRSRCLLRGNVGELWGIWEICSARWPSCTDRWGKTMTGQLREDKNAQTKQIQKLQQL